MAYNMGGRRFRPVGSGKKRTAPQYGPGGHRLPVCGGGRGAAVPGAERGTFLEPDERPELCAGIADQGTGAAGCGGGPPERGRPLGTPAHPGGAGRGPAALAAPHPERAELSAAVHLGKERRGGKGQRHPPHGGAQSGAAPWSMRWKRTASTVWCWIRGQALPRWMSPCSAGC